MKPEEFVDYLCNFEERGDRAALAHLRRGLSGETRDLIRVYPLILNLSPQKPRAQQAHIDLACLFGSHPSKHSERSRGVSLGKAMRLLSSKSDSVESRFIALLQCHPEQLTLHLRHCVALAKSNAILLKWDDILRALLFWDAPNNKYYSTPQMRWATDFWGEEAPSDDITTSEQERTAS